MQVTQPDELGNARIGLYSPFFASAAYRPMRPVLVIMDADERVGDSWRNRWDSLRLFTPARHDGLPGLRFPGPAWSFPTKDDGR